MVLLLAVLPQLGTLFIDPIDVGSYWYWLLAPMALAIAIVYKTLKVQHVKHVAASAAVLMFTILAGMAAAAGLLYVVSHVFSMQWTW